jgi:sterol desaturase/sphingolipid hydroxylase (fatty acid hydroxylase superfamily)
MARTSRPVEALARVQGPDGTPLSVAARTATLRDMLSFWKARKLFYVWGPFCIATAAIGIALVRDPLAIVAAALFGIVVYSFIEYVAHRWFYHHVPESRILQLATGNVAREHLRHHDDPGKYGGAINGVQGPIVAFAAVLALLAWAVPFVPTGFCLVAIAAGGANYVAQELVHFSAHHMPMQRGFIGVIQRHHMLHHYRDDDTNFGLFWPHWDYILGTSYRGARRPRSSGREAVDGSS